MLVHVVLWLYAESGDFLDKPCFPVKPLFLTLLSSPHLPLWYMALPDADFHNAICLILISSNLVFKREERGGKKRHISEGSVHNHFRQIAFSIADEQIFVNQLSNGKL